MVFRLMINIVVLYERLYDHAKVQNKSLQASDAVSLVSVE